MDGVCPFSIWNEHIATLPTSLQPVCLSLCHPASARWPRCLPESRNHGSPSLAGGSVAAACRWFPSRHTDTPGNEPRTPAACRGWDSRTIQIYHMIHSITLCEPHYPSAVWKHHRMSVSNWSADHVLNVWITSVLWDSICPLCLGLCWWLKGFQW